MSIAGSSTTATLDDQTITLSSWNPMYNVVTGHVPSMYDQITEERMMRNGSPPFQREQAAPGYISRPPNQRAPSGFGEKPTIDTSDEVSSTCSGLLCVYIFALLFLILSLVSLFLAFCLLLGVVSPVRQMSSTATPTSGTTSPPNTCNCPDAVKVQDLSSQLQDLQVAAGVTMAQLQTILNGSVSNRATLNSRLNQVSLSLSTVEHNVNSSIPVPTTANIVTPLVTSSCSVERFTINCNTAVLPCHAKLTRFKTPGNFVANLQCQITDVTNGQYGDFRNITVTRRILPGDLNNDPSIEVDSDFLMNGWRICQCEFVEGTNRNFNCTTIVRRCPLTRNLTNVIFNT